MRVAEPAVEAQYRAHLGSHVARAAGDVPPAVSQHALPMNDGLIVPAQIPKPLIDGMSVQAVQLHDGAPLRVPHIPIPASTSWSLLGRVPPTSWVPVRS